MVSGAPGLFLCGPELRKVALLSEGFSLLSSVYLSHGKVISDPQSVKGCK